MTASADSAAALAAGVLGGYATIVAAPPGLPSGSASRGTVVWAFPGLTPATAAGPAARSRLRSLARSVPPPLPGTGAGAGGVTGYTPPRPSWRPAGAVAAVGLLWAAVAVAQVAVLGAAAVHLRATYVGGGGAVTRAARAAFFPARAYALAFIGGGLVRAVTTRRGVAEWSAAVERTPHGGEGTAAAFEAAAAAEMAETVRRRRSWEGVVGVPGGRGWIVEGETEAEEMEGEGLYPSI